MNDSTSISSNPIAFKAETRQLLEILIHSLYTEREVFLRELISNASDALTRLNFEMLTEREIANLDLELGIWITADPEQKTLTIRDTGIGMNAEELSENLGTIAHSGARAFLEAARSGAARVDDIIGQFGVGFYSAFMVADWIQVASRSYRLDTAPAVWFSTGSDTYTLSTGGKQERGTEITLRLKDEYVEFCQESRLRQIIKRHSDFVPFPIYLGEAKEQANQQTALWRRQPREVESEQYQDYYRQLTMEFDPPLTWLHLSVDAPVQMYALLYAPSSSEPGILSTRKNSGLRLYARKILIQEYCKELLPEYLRFMVGVVDSEDLPLNVSRESVQSTRTMAQLKKLLTSKVLDHLAGLAKDNIDNYTKFWIEFGQFLKEGIAIPDENHDPILPLLRFHSMKHPQEWISLDQYLETLADEKEPIYYLLADHETAALRSPHLEAFRERGLDVLLLTDPIDPFAVLNLPEYKSHKLVNAADADLPVEGKSSQAEHPEEQTTPENTSVLVERFKSVLGDRISAARLSNRLVESPVRLVRPKDGPSEELQRVYRMLQKDLHTPNPILEVNAGHPIIQALAALPAEDPNLPVLIEQIFTNAQILEGMPVDPSQMVDRIQKIILQSLKQTGGGE